MFESHPFLLALLAGFVSGFLVSIPVGPVNVTIVNEGVQTGFPKAFLIGLGSVIMEVIYCAIGFAGFAGFFDFKVARAALELSSFVLMLFLGLKYMLARALPENPPIEQQIERRLHPHTAFMVGFVRTAGNPAILLLWVTLAAAFSAHEWVQNTAPSKFFCVLGVGLGALFWFTLLSFCVSLGHQRLSNRTLLTLSKISGASLLLVALFTGGRLVILLAERHVKVPPKIERLLQMNK
jgi:threonine/homoserine/homoserine lactone efflux protein